MFLTLKYLIKADVSRAASFPKKHDNFLTPYTGIQGIRDLGYSIHVVEVMDMARGSKQQQEQIGAVWRDMG